MSAFEDYENYLQEKITQDLLSFSAPDINTSLKSEGSRWKVTSAMQKAIRRSHENVAMRMGVALATSTESYFWYRICVVAMEDIMFADIETCNKVLYLASNKKLREQHGNKICASYVLSMLANAKKDRSACDAIVMAWSANEFKNERKNFFKMTDNELLKVVHDSKNPFGARVVAAQYVVGVNNDMYQKRKGNYLTLVDSFFDLSVQYRWCSYMGFKRKAEGMAITVGLIASTYLPSKPKYVNTAFPDFTVLKAVPDYAFDAHVMEGKDAMFRFSRICKPLRPIIEKVKQTGKCPESAIKSMFFRAYSDPVSDRLVLKDKGYLRDHAGYGFLQHKHGLDRDEFWHGVNIMEANYEQLLFCRKLACGYEAGKKPESIEV